MANRAGAAGQQASDTAEAGGQTLGGEKITPRQVRYDKLCLTRGDDPVPGTWERIREKQRQEREQERKEREAAMAERLASLVEERDRRTAEDIRRHAAERGPPSSEGDGSMPEIATDDSKDSDFQEEDNDNGDGGDSDGGHAQAQPPQQEEETIEAHEVANTTARGETVQLRLVIEPEEGAARNATNTRGIAEGKPLQ